MVTASSFDSTARTIAATVKNIGSAPAGPFRIYIEINQVGASAAAKPEAQLSVVVSALAPGAEHVVPATALLAFSARPSINLATITSLELVVNADAKDEVAESDESNNVRTTTF